MCFLFLTMCHEIKDFKAFLFVNECYIHYISNCYDQMPDKKLLKEGWVYPGSQLQDAVHRVRGGLGQLVTMPLQSGQREMNADAQLIFSFLFNQNPSTQDITTHI